MDNFAFLQAGVRASFECMAASRPRRLLLDAGSGAGRRSAPLRSVNFVNFGLRIGGGEAAA
jgi:hypothetical protein